MSVSLPKLNPERNFLSDTIDWFLGHRHGHMGKWQYLKPLFEGDPCRGQELWDVWENLSQTGNMLNRQKQIIKNCVHDMTAITGPVHQLIDLGPGGKHAVTSNTLPFIQSYGSNLKSYIAIDINGEFANEAANEAKNACNHLKVEGLNHDFYASNLPINHNVLSAVLFNGGTIGNFQAEQNTSQSINLMADQIRRLKNNMPLHCSIFIGLEATQDPDLLYEDYDHPAHAEYEINVMYGIKRDLVPDQAGFDPAAWKYSMRWWPDAFQFCHIAEATETQRFKLQGKEFYFPKGKQLVVDNSFKFPILAMQRAAQIAGAKYISSFADNDERMMIHALRF